MDMKKLGADFGYTIDGEQRGSIEDETFSADMVTMTIHGVSIHPGFAKGKLESAAKIAGEILAKNGCRWIIQTTQTRGLVYQWGQSPTSRRDYICGPGTAQPPWRRRQKGLYGSSLSSAERTASSCMS